MRALAFSGGKDSMACLHLLRDTLDCAIYVDTGYAYPETAALVEYAAQLVPMHVVRSDRAGQNAREGLPADVVPIDWTSLGQTITGQKAVMVQSYLGCCHDNISRPLLDAAKALGATELVYGQRNDEGHKSPARHGDVIEGILRLQPIEEWTAAQVLDYLRTQMELPTHYGLRHSSLDCYDCTAYRADSADRVEWMREQHPALHAEYQHRADALADALMEAS